MIAAFSDTTVLSNFAHVQRPDLLRMLFRPLYVPDSVRGELAQGESAGLIPEADWGFLDPKEADLLLTQMRKQGYRSPVTSLKETGLG